jgi:protein-disulfide isomerase
MNFNMESWSTCLSLKETENAVLSGSDLANSLKISSVPTIFINNKKITLVKGIDLTGILTQLITTP